MSIMWTVALGLAAGVVARLVTPGRKGPFGFMVTGLLGIIGALRRRIWDRRRDGIGRRTAPGGSSRVRSGRSASDLGTPLQEPTPNILSLTLTNLTASSMVDSGERSSWTMSGDG
jgi:hypothetical protein